MSDSYYILGPGRSGSSLLASILATSGANFEVKPEKNWNALTGSMEHEACHSAYKYLSRIQKIKDSIFPAEFTPLSLLEKQFSRELEKILKLEYAKSTNLYKLVPFIVQRGHKPKIIISYRDFEGYAKSRLVRFGWDYSKLEYEWLNSYRTSLLLMQICGGLTIDYNDVISPERDEWLTALSRLTTLSFKRLLTSRKEIVKTKAKADSRSSSLHVKPSKIIELESKLISLKNTIY